MAAREIRTEFMRGLPLVAMVNRFTTTGRMRIGPLHPGDGPVHPSLGREGPAVPVMNEARESSDGFYGAESGPKDLCWLAVLHRAVE